MWLVIILETGNKFVGFVARWHQERFIYLGLALNWDELFEHIQVVSY